jgi:DNA-binding NarL/FixJ family response regulator
MNITNFEGPSHSPLIDSASSVNSAYLKVASTSPTFVIIDDQPLEALGLQAMLQQHHKDACIYIASSYASGDDLIAEKLIDGRIDLILAYIDLKTDSYLTEIEQLHRKYPYICLAVFAPINTTASPADSNLVLQCLEAGAVGYLPKAASIDILQNAIKSVLKGNIYIPSEVMKAPQGIQINTDEGFMPTHQLSAQSPSQPFSGLISLSSRQYLQSLAGELTSNPFKRPPAAKVLPIRSDVASFNSLQVSKTIKPTITGYEIGLTGRQVDVLDLILLGLSNKRICRELDLAEGTVKVHVSAVLRALGARTRTEAVVTASNLGLKSRITG